MKAMILAAGFGTRLGEAGKQTPKCLMRAGGLSLLEHAVANLRKAGVDSFVVNTHHLSSQVEAYVCGDAGLSASVCLSHEEKILGTGGGLAHAKGHFINEECFFMHNADAYSDFELEKLLSEHRSHAAIATLLMMDIPTGRPLYFNSEAMLGGWGTKQGERFLSEEKNLRPLCFSGIQVLSPEIFKYMDTDGAEFSIIESYMRAAQAGEKVRACIPQQGFWLDAGTPESLAALQERLGGFSAGK